ncbi:MAG: hypothetical protein IKL18_05575 [Oscillospiraceae bacterium]|nr:hypothetical protein [Oscillospiraceae bacterium]
MAEQKTNGNAFKEAVCIDAGRIYDSCSDKDCLEDLQVYFTEAEQAKIDRALSVKAKSVEVLNVFLEVEPIPFNRGFYSVDMTFYFLVNLSAYYTPVSTADTVTGLAFFSKKVILYGSEGNVKVFSSEMPFGGNGNVSDSPRAVVQAVTPIVLSSRISDCCECDCGGCELNFPECVANCFCGNFVVPNCGRKVLITLGLFTIVQLERRVQMLIPAYDFCIPGKECVTTTDDPCEVFKHIKFPTNEFFPPRLEETDGIGVCSCGCG